MLIKFHEQIIDNFLIPSFTLAKGEIIIIHLPSGPYLPGNPRRKLSLYTTLSWTSNIVFDLVGVDPKGGEDIYNFVKTVVASGGAAVLFDHSDEFRNDCTAFIQARYLGGNSQNEE